MEKELTFTKGSFRGGMNRLDDTTKLADDQYAMLVNGRARNNIIEPIMRPSRVDSGLPTVCKYQGVYAAGSIALVFIGGQAWFKNFAVSDSDFVQIPDLQLSPTVETIYVEFVPTSGRNFNRTAGASANAPILLGAGIAQSPQCVVVQDGINQPWVINSNATARQLNTFAQWLPSNQEYVPIGQQMLYHNGILYVVSPSGTEIYRSVTGRPLDFVVAVDNAGDKVGDATTVSHAIDYAAITCIKSLNTDANAIFIGTSYRSYMMMPVFTTTIYGEPTFNNIPLFTAGPLNQFSFIELQGDNAFLTFSGIRSFNAVLQLKNEGKNSPFSSQVAPLMDGIIQGVTCAINYDDYAMFFVKTVHGDAVLVYDTIRNTWVGLDKLTGILGIKQFAEVKIPGLRKLFFITSGGMYEYYGSTYVETVGMYIGDFTTGSPNVQHKPAELNLVFNEPIEYGLIYASIFTDSKQGNTYRKYVSDIVTPLPKYRGFPFGAAADDRIRVARFDIGREKTGWKVGAYVTWTFNAKLSYAQLNTQTAANTESQATILAERTTGAVVLFNGIRITDFNAVPVDSIIEVGVTDSSIRIVAIRFCSTTIQVLEDNAALSSKDVDDITYYFKRVRWTSAAADISTTSVSRISCELVLITESDAICASPVVLFEPIKTVLRGDCGIVELLPGGSNPTVDPTVDPGGGGPGGPDAPPEPCLTPSSGVLGGTVTVQFNSSTAGYNQGPAGQLVQAETERLLASGGAIGQLTLFYVAGAAGSADGWQIGTITAITSDGENSIITLGTLTTNVKYGMGATVFLAGTTKINGVELGTDRCVTFPPDPPSHGDPFVCGNLITVTNLYAKVPAAPPGPDGVCPCYTVDLSSLVVYAHAKVRNAGFIRIVPNNPDGTPPPEAALQVFTGREGFPYEVCLPNPGVHTFQAQADTEADENYPNGCYDTDIITITLECEPCDALITCNDEFHNIVRTAETPEECPCYDYVPFDAVVWLDGCESVGMSGGTVEQDGVIYEAGVSYCFPVGEYKFDIVATGTGGCVQHCVITLVVTCELPCDVVEYRDFGTFIKTVPGYVGPNAASDYVWRNRVDFPALYEEYIIDTVSASYAYSGAIIPEDDEGAGLSNFCLQVVDSLGPVNFRVTGTHKITGCPLDGTYTVDMRWDCSLLPASVHFSLPLTNMGEGSTNYSGEGTLIRGYDPQGGPPIVGDCTYGGQISIHSHQPPSETTLEDEDNLYNWHIGATSKGNSDWEWMMSTNMWGNNPGLSATGPTIPATARQNGCWVGEPPASSKTPVGVYTPVSGSSFGAQGWVITIS